MGFLHVFDTYDGTLTRTMATGVDFHHKVLLSYYIADIPLTVIQAGLIIFCVWWDRGDQIKGDWALIGLILYLPRIVTIGLHHMFASLKISVKDTILVSITLVQISLYASGNYSTCLSWNLQNRRDIQGAQSEAGYVHNSWTSEKAKISDKVEIAWTSSHANYPNPICVSYICSSWWILNESVDV